MGDDDSSFVELEVPGSKNKPDAPEESDANEEKLPVRPRIEEKPFIQTRSRVMPTEIQKTNDANQNRISAPVTRINYRFVGKEALVDLIRKVIPPEFTPTKRTAQFLGYIFLAALVISLLRFPVSSIFSESTESSAIKVGIPFAFLTFDLVNTENSPLKIFGFILDIIIYLILAYIADVSINYFNSQAKSLSVKERNKHPKILKIEKKEESWAEKMTDKVFGN